MSTPPSTAGYASSIKEGFTSAGIWVILTALFLSGIRLWAMYAYPEKTISLEECVQVIGSTVGQFVLMAICLSSVALYRGRKNVTSFVLLDWRWWLGLVFLSLLLKNPPLAWVWVGLIYQVRLSLKRNRDRRHKAHA